MVIALLLADVEWLLSYAATYMCALIKAGWSGDLYTRFTSVFGNENAQRSSDANKCCWNGREMNDKKNEAPSFCHITMFLYFLTWLDVVVGETLSIVCCRKCSTAAEWLKTLAMRKRKRGDEKGTSSENEMSNDCGKWALARNVEKFQRMGSAGYLFRMHLPFPRYFFKQRNIFRQNGTQRKFQPPNKSWTNFRRM